MSEETKSRPIADVDYESTPLSRSEYISAMVHLYRGELYRSNSWRLRLDNTTNWAVITTAGLLTFSFGDAKHSHWTLLFGLALITVFLGFEARRFRFAHMWRSRVRMIEENFYGPILRRDLTSPEQRWGSLVADDLFRPRFKIGRLASLRTRIVRNYWTIYSVILLAWVVKILTHPTVINHQDTGMTIAELKDRLTISPFPWWTALIYVGGFIFAALALIFFGPRTPRNELQYWTEDYESPDEASLVDI